MVFSVDTTGDCLSGETLKYTQRLSSQAEKPLYRVRYSTELTIS
jgi:hypothetical protein